MVLPPSRARLPAVLAFVAVCLAAPTLLAGPASAKPAPTRCDATVGSLDAARSRVQAPAPGKVVCLKDGATRSSRSGAAARGRRDAAARRPGQGDDRRGRPLRLPGDARKLPDLRRSGGRGARVADPIVHNHIDGGYFGIDAATANDDLNDVAIVGNKLTGPYGEDAIRPTATTTPTTTVTAC